MNEIKPLKPVTPQKKIKKWNPRKNLGIGLIMAAIFVPFYDSSLYFTSNTGYFVSGGFLLLGCCVLVLPKLISKNKNSDQE